MATKLLEAGGPIGGSKGEKQPPGRLPLYTVRQPPLVQPLETSPFVKRTLAKFGVRDLGHEWVTLFHTIGAATGGYSTSMKLNVPDTVLLSPSGLPSMWYATSASAHIKPKNLMRVTPRSIFDTFTVSSSSSGASPSEDSSVAVCRTGFDVEVLTLRQLKAFVSEMEHPRVVVRRDEWEQADADDDGDDARSDDGSSADKNTLPQRPFCLQRFVPREQNMSFLVLWRCKHRNDELRAPDNVSDNQFARSFYKRPLPLLTSDVSSKCDVFLLQRLPPSPLQRGDNVDASDDNDDDGDEDESDGARTRDVRGAEAAGRQTARDSLAPLDLESPTLFKDALLARGFDSDVIVSQLCHMKLTASEILNRLNRGLHGRQACGIACEFFVGARDRKVYFAGLSGTHWENAPPSWETLRYVDATSRALADFLETRRREKFSPVRHNSVQSSPGSRVSAFTLTGMASPSEASSDEESAALRQYSELNPRFPSVQSPYVSEKQWRFQSPLLPPDISPRYIGTQVPKSYRNGKFHSLLTPKQADSVNRLNLSPRPPAALIQHPLSKQFAKLEILTTGTSTQRLLLSPRTTGKATAAETATPPAAR